MGEPRAGGRPVWGGLKWVVVAGLDGGGGSGRMMGGVVVVLGGLGASPRVGRRGRGRGRGWLVAVVGAVAVVAASCGGGGSSGGDGPGATVPEGSAGSGSSASTTTTAPAAIDITAKPDVVTVAYADAVMDELDRLLSEAIREFVANDGPTKRFDDLLNAVYDEPSLENQRSAYGRFALDGTSEFRDPPGDVTTDAVELLKAEPACVVIEVRRTFAATLHEPQAQTGDTVYVALKPTSPDADPSRLNGTPWSIVFDGDVVDGDDPRTAC